MNWTTVIWSMIAGVCLAAAGVHLLVWLQNRDSRASLAFALSAIGAAATAFVELALMHSQTAAQYARALQLLHVPVFVLVASFIWFVRAYLQTGRAWLLWTFLTVRALILIVDLVSVPNGLYEVTALRFVSMWGDTFAVPSGMTNPWSFLVRLSEVLLLLFIGDASYAAWKKGKRRQALNAGAVFFVAAAVGATLSFMMLKATLRVPLTLSMPFLLGTLVMGVDMSLDLIRVQKISRELRESQERMSLAVSAANLTPWEYDLARDKIWTTKKGIRRIRAGGSSQLTADGFFESIHPEDREDVRKTGLRAIETGGEFLVEYRTIDPGGETRWIRSFGQVERDGRGTPLRVRGVSMDITERMNHENELEFIKKSIDASPDGAYWMDVAGRFVYVNDVGCASLGYSRDEMLSMSIFDIAPLASAEGWREVWKFLREKSEYSTETVHRRKDGSEFPVEITSTYVVMAAHEYVSGFARDITERKLHDDALRESLERYRAMVESFDGFVYICSADFRIEFMNQRMIERTGHNAVGEPCYRALHDKGSVCEWCVNEQVFKGEIVRWEVQSPKDNRWYDVVNTPIRHANGTLSKQSLVMDITDRKQAEVALKESEKRLREAQRIATIGNWELDLMTNILAWSDEIFRIFEIEREHFGASYETFLAAVHPDDRDAVNDAYKGSLENRKPYNITHRLLMPDGRIKYVQERCETYYSPEGKPVRSVGTVQDVTERIHVQRERRELRHELAHLNRVMSMNELAASLAHEINQPLGAIMNNIAAAKTICTGCEGGNGEVLEILEDVLKDATRAGQVVRKVRGAVKKEDSRREFEILNMNVTVHDAINLLQSTLKMNQINVHLDKQPDLLPVRGDRVRLEQVIVNLVTNAVEAMKESPEKTLTIRTAMHSPEMVIISVSNSGSGIDAEIRERLFEPFFTTKESGLGMGLRICRSIVEEHGGQMWLEDPTDDRTTFSFTLKVNQGDAA